MLNIRAVSYFGGNSLEQAQTDLDTMAQGGVNAIVLPMTEQDVRFDEGRIAALAAEVKKRGMKVWLVPWGLGGVMGGDAPAFSPAENVQSLQRSSEGKALPALCPFSRAFQTVVLSWLVLAEQVGANVVVWDDPHLITAGPDEDFWSCRCSGCQGRFKAKYKRRMPEVWDIEVGEFLRDQLFDMICTWLGERPTRYHMQSAVILPAVEEGFHPAPWRALVLSSKLSYLGTEPRWFANPWSFSAQDGWIREWIRRTQAATMNTSTRPMLWVQGYRTPDGREHEIESALLLADHNRIESVGVWTSHGAPVAAREATWRVISRTYRNFARVYEPEQDKPQRRFAPGRR